MRTYLIKESGGFKRNIGFIESGTYYTHRDKKNLFLQFNGFSISASVLGYLNESNVNEIVIDFQGYEFETSPLMFCASGTTYNYGEDKQKVLCLNLFNNYEHQIELNQGVLI